MRKFGGAFSDHIELEHRSGRHRGEITLTGWGVRISILSVLLILGFGILLLRLIDLTLIQGSAFRTLSENNRIRERIIHAPRGIITDRQGVVLVRNTPAFRLITACAKKEGCVEILSSDEVLAREAKGTIDSTFLEIDVTREYLYPYEFAHVLGFLSEITDEELHKGEFIYQGYRLGDRLGRDGVEKHYEKKVRGRNGKELFEVDAQGQKLRLLGKVPEKEGENLTLSLDLQLQKTAYQALGNISGAAIVTKSDTGEVLALVSTPSFDANRLHRGISQEEFQALVNNPDKPMFNRAIAGLYPPGSIFKIITATAALEEGAIDKSTLIEDTGVLQIGQYSYANWYFTQYGKKEGLLDIVGALQRSNDIFFYKAGELLGIEKLSLWGRKFGIEKPSDIELEGEARGVMPDPLWRKKIRGDQWFLGDTYHAAIGQGDIQVTPLQVTRWIDVIANGGYLCAPTLEKVTPGSDLKKRQGMTPFDTKNCKDLRIHKSTLELIKEGMKKACSEGGTGGPFFGFTPQVACKTGTAEFNDPEGKTHAWFTAFAPVDDPEITVTVLVEKGGEGSVVAAPIAKRIMEEWFRR